MEFGQFAGPTIADFGALSAAEQKVIDACGTSEWVHIGGARPEAAVPDNTVRARLIRYLMFGGCTEQRPDAVGVNIAGAVIAGDLDLQDCRTPLSLSLVNCLFDGGVLFADCRLGLVNLSGSKLRGIQADRGGFASEVDLSDAEVSGFVDFSHSKIGGLLDCSGGQFGAWLNCDGMSVGGGVFLRNGFSVAGDVVLRGAQIGGQLACSGGRFGAGLICDAMSVEGPVFLSDGFSAEKDVILRGAQIGGQLACDGGRFGAGLEGQGCRVAADFFFLDVTVEGDVDLRGMCVGVLSDNLRSWQSAGRYLLNGFVYDSLASADMGVADRIAWVKGNAVGILPQPTPWTRMIGLEAKAGYEPHPYRQLAATYEAMGHVRSAAKVREAGEAHRWQWEWELSRVRLDGGIWAALRSLRMDLAWSGALFLRLIAGFGFAPARALGWAVLIVLLSIWYFHKTYEAGQMAPNSDVILASADWARAVEKSCDPQETPEDGCLWPAQVWTSDAHNSSVAKDYESFSAIGYGIDLFIPLDALGQENAWAPSYDRGMWGKNGFYLRWVIQMLGWIITAVGAAALTGLIGRKT